VSWRSRCSGGGSVHEGDLGAGQGECWVGNLGKNLSSPVEKRKRYDLAMAMM
jgi:hypothetical protein